MENFIFCAMIANIQLILLSDTDSIESYKFLLKFSIFSFDIQVWVLSFILRTDSSIQDTE